MNGKKTTHAAVAVILAPGKAGGREILFIRRAEHPRDPWSGHIGLPGGRRDPSDRSLLETAIREVREETGIRLRRTSLLRALEMVRPLSPSLPPISIRPYVFVLSRRPKIRPSHEVAGYFWASVRKFRAGERTARVRVRGRQITTPAYRLGRRVIWGLTRRILRLFFEISWTRN